MADINLSPYTPELEAIQQRRKMAELLSQQSMQPMEMPQVAGARVSPYAGLAKMLQAYTGAQMQGQAQAEQKALADRYASESSSDMQGLLKGLTAPAQAAVPEGAPTYTPNIGQGDMADNARMMMRPERNEMGEIIQPNQPGAGNFGMTPGAPAQAARPAGELTPEGFGAMKTPAGQQQYMAQLLAQRAPKAPIKLGKDENLLDPTNYSILAKGPVDPNSGLAPLNQKDYTPDSWRAATLSGGMDRSKLIPSVEGPAGLAVYNLYVQQEKAAGRVPKSIERFQTDQQIAGRPQAPLRERYVYDAARGGRVNLDTGELLPVTQGGQPIGIKDRGLSTGEVDKITAIDVSSGTQQRLADTFQDSYGGYPLKSAGELANVMGAKFGGANEAQSQWWASHEANDNVSRNALFGASLTAGEQKAWDKTTINPGMSPSMIRARMTERQALIDAKRETTVGNLEKAGFDVKGFKEKSNAFATPAAKVTTRQEIQDVATQTGKSIEQVTKDAIAKGYKVQ
jgi:hypothetical protein